MIFGLSRACEKQKNPGEAMAADSPFRVTTPQSCTASASGNANSPMKVGGERLGAVRRDSEGVELAGGAYCKTRLV